MLSLKTDVNVPTARKKQKKLRKITWHLESHRKKEQDSDP
jgi:hypothetical protein